MDTKITLKHDLQQILQSTPAERTRAIIDSPHTREILEQLSPQETYMILKESWGTDSQILLQYVPPETVCHCIDMDCWDRDTLAFDSLLDWLWELYNSSLDTLQDALQSLDLDILVLLYQSYIDVVQVVPTDESIADLLDAGYESFDDVYYFMFREEDERMQLLKDMLSLIFTHYQNTYYSIMEAVIWELRSSIEECVYERRSLRLMEMGFPPPDEAMSIYRRIRPGKLVNAGVSKEKVPIIDRESDLLPALYMDHLAENRDLIVSTMAEASPETKERFIYEMIYLANKIIMADYKPLNDVSTLKSSIEKASSLTSLGLAVAMKESGKQAKEVLETINAETLFSLGYNSLLDQKSRLKEILRTIDLSMIPTGMSGFVEGFMQKRPLFGTEEFSTLDQLEEVTRGIDMIEYMAQVLESLAWDKGSASLKGTNTGSSVDLEAVLLTSLVNNAVSQSSVFIPVNLADLVSFLKKVSVGKRSGKRELVPEFRQNLRSFLSSLQKEARRDLVDDLAEILIKRFDDELSGILEPEDLDPRYITCFVVRIS